MPTKIPSSGCFYSVGLLFRIKTSFAWFSIAISQISAFKILVHCLDFASNEDGCIVRAPMGRRR